MPLRRRCALMGTSALAATPTCEMWLVPLPPSELVDDFGPSQRERHGLSRGSSGNFSSWLGRRLRTRMILTRTSAEGFPTRMAEKEGTGIIAGLHVLRNVGHSRYKEKRRCWVRVCVALPPRIRGDISLWAK
mmetsp:Transcript_5293/g.12628  ORF Transcript_5293/g.12628 Transcript_5293/m.12628 type:complete len:132 (+) Transcript_5293:128-523(+)